MSVNFCAFNHRDWSAYNLADYGDFAECVEWVNQQEDGCDQLRGEWWYSPDEVVTVDRQGTFRVIYYGSFGNYNSPGASSYTYAELYDVADADDVADYAKAVERWEGFPEYLETEGDEEDGWEDADDDGEPAEEDGEEVAG
jgi:hypothetical protein